MPDRHGPMRVIVQNQEIPGTTWEQLETELPNDALDRTTRGILRTEPPWLGNELTSDERTAVNDNFGVDVSVIDQTLSELTVTNNGTQTISTVSVSGAGVVFEDLAPGNTGTATDLTVTRTDGAVTITVDTGDGGGFSSLEAERQVEPGGTLTLDLIGGGGELQL